MSGVRRFAGLEPASTVELGRRELGDVMPVRHVAAREGPKDRDRVLEQPGSQQKADVGVDQGSRWCVAREGDGASPGARIGLVEHDAGDGLEPAVGMCSLVGPTLSADQRADGDLRMQARCSERGPGCWRASRKPDGL